MNYHGSLIYPARTNKVVGTVNKAYNEKYDNKGWGVKADTIMMSPWQVNHLVSCLRLIKNNKSYLDFKKMYRLL